MTCVASISQDSEWETNGCVKDHECTNDEEACDGKLMYNCERGPLVATDCEKLWGPGSLCALEPGEDPRCTPLPCDEPAVLTCDGTVNLICNEDGELHIQDCARCDPYETCNSDQQTPSCGPNTYSCGFSP